MRERENHLHLHYAVSLLASCVGCAEEGSGENLNRVCAFDPETHHPQESLTMQLKSLELSLRREEIVFAQVSAQTSPLMGPSPASDFKVPSLSSFPFLPHRKQSLTTSQVFICVQFASSAGHGIAC